MATATSVTPVPLTIDLDTIERVVLRPGPDFSDDDFFNFCQLQNKLLRIERSAEGEIIIMSPVGGEGSYAESKVNSQLDAWADGDGRGIVFSPNVGLQLPDGSTLSPDACWVPLELWEAVPRRQRRRFVPVVPPFVIEIRSPTDRIKDLHEKMLTYLRNGVELGWLIDPIARKVRIYRQGEPFVELENPSRVEGEGPVAGFVLDLRKMYELLDK
jgi:Uma2 family endonuclease